MKKKNFQTYLKKRLTKAEISKIEHQAKLEKKAFEILQNNITQAINNYMKKEKIGFNELARRLNVSPTHIAKIKKGQANLTLLSIARISSLLEKDPHLVFRKEI